MALLASRPCRSGANLSFFMGGGQNPKKSCPWSHSQGLAGCYKYKTLKNLFPGLFIIQPLAFAAPSNPSNPTAESMAVLPNSFGDHRAASAHSAFFSTRKAFGEKNTWSLESSICVGLRNPVVFRKGQESFGR